jgi:8-oxo-dGTP pyrophosphatase MutT (NUDIX family)
MVIARVPKLAEGVRRGQAQLQALRTAGHRRLTLRRYGATASSMTADVRPIRVDLDSIRVRLADRVPRRVDGASRRAAIAAILRRTPLDTELLLIKRAERDGDPWSGHMALPGGHLDPRDPDLLATARRETLEEVGLDLRQHELLGALDEHDFSAQGHFNGLVIAPFVFALHGDVELRPNHEVAELLWGSLGRMARGETDVIKEQERDGRIMRRQGFGVGEHVVWGMTHRVLKSLFDAIGE